MRLLPPLLTALLLLLIVRHGHACDIDLLDTGHAQFVDSAYRGRCDVDLDVGNSYDWHFTVEMWVKPWPVGDTSFPLFSLQKGDGPGASDFALTVHNSKFNLQHKTGFVSSIATDFSNDAWFHVAVTVTGDYNDDTKSHVPLGNICCYEFYKDAKKVGNTVNVGGYCPFSGLSGCMVLGQVQTRQECGGFRQDWEFQGSMTEFRIWDTTRTEAEINSTVTPLRRRIDAAAAAHEPHLRALWPLDCTYLFDDISSGGHHLSSCEPHTDQWGGVAQLAWIASNGEPKLPNPKPYTLNPTP